MKTFWRWDWIVESTAPTVSLPVLRLRAVSSSTIELDIHPVVARSRISTFFSPSALEPDAGSGIERVQESL
ncbi:hypothetical protein [Halalkalicoccus salilacus]|uniref:hypothetical protein n=1 Tax=Halalkalicoccus sp. GCM10025704 TaxID=3252662 RepID=UPI00360F557A